MEHEELGRKLMTLEDLARLVFLEWTLAGLSDCHSKIYSQGIYGFYNVFYRTN
jgi:hypothetical protein